MSIRHELKRSINQVLSRNKDGSYATQADRQKILMRFAEDLISLGYGLRHIQGLKTKHIQAITEYWKSKELSNATIKNRTAVLRYLAGKINKNNLIPQNDALKIEARSYTPKVNRALVNPDFSKITNEYIYMSLQLQRLFGLRREESLKIKPFLADRRESLYLQPSWCKGGRERVIPIRTAEQREWLEKAKALVKHEKNSLIPEGKSYIQHRHLYDKQIQRAGFKNLHGLRHAYAQQRYKEMTGWEAPIKGGLTSKQLTKEQKIIDQQARMMLTEELGHSREQITVNYCGR